MVINRYILKNLAGVGFFITVILTLLVMLTQSLRFLELIIETGAPPLSFFKMLGLAIPRFLEVILPLSIATSVVFIYNKMISENELIILRASGATQRQLMMPAIYMAIIGFLIMIFLTLWGAPASHAKLEVLRNQIKTQYAGLLLREGVFNPIDDGLMIYMDERNSNSDLSGLLIHDSREEDSPPVTIIAERGEIFIEDDETTKLIVHNGKRQNYRHETKSLDILNFKEYTIEVENAPRAVKDTWKKPDERTIFELLKPGPRTLNNDKLQYMVQAEVHRRIATPFSVFSFVIVSLACLLVGAFNRRGHSKRIFAASGFIILIESMVIGVTNILDDHIWAIPLLYFCVLVPIVIGVYFISPMRESLKSKVVNKRRPA